MCVCVIATGERSPILESRDDLHGPVEVGHVPAGEGHTQDTGQHGLPVLMSGLRDDHVCYPRGDLQREGGGGGGVIYERSNT